MKIFNIPSIWPFSFYQEKPTAIRVFPCPACKETISADANNCRFCHLPIDAATAERLLLENQRVTDAVAGANTFRLSISLAALVILWWIIGVLTKDPSPAVFLPLVGIGLRRFMALQVWIAHHERRGLSSCGQESETINPNMASGIGPAVGYQ
jgi:hypothetical protein